MPTTRPKITPRTFRQFEPSTDELKYEFSYNPVETAALHARLNNMATLDVCDLRRVSLWKLDRVLNVSESTLSKLRAVAAAKKLVITDKVAKEAIEDLVASEGVGFPMASAILKFIKPEVFPIIDIRAYRALTGKKPYYSTYTLTKYLDYARRLGEISKAAGRPLREVDEQLYCFDEKYNGKI